MLVPSGECTPVKESCSIISVRNAASAIREITMWPPSMCLSPCLDQHCGASLCENEIQWHVVHHTPGSVTCVDWPLDLERANIPWCLPYKPVRSGAVTPVSRMSPLHGHCCSFQASMRQVPCCERTMLLGGRQARLPSLYKTEAPLRSQTTAAEGRQEVSRSAIATQGKLC